MLCGPQACRPQVSWNQKADVINSHLPQHQSLGRIIPQADHTLFEPSIINFSLPSQRQAQFLEALDCGVSSLAGKEIKPLFLFPPSSVSIFLFSTCVQKPRFQQDQQGFNNHGA